MVLSGTPLFSRMYQVKNVFALSGLTLNVKSCEYCNIDMYKLSVVSSRIYCAGITIGSNGAHRGSTTWISRMGVV